MKLVVKNIKMSTVQAVINNETKFKNSKIKMKHEMNSINKESFNGDSIISSTKVCPKNLEEQFKAACETIQSLPKNGIF